MTLNRLTSLISKLESHLQFADGYFSDWDIGLVSSEDSIILTGTIEDCSVVILIYSAREFVQLYFDDSLVDEFNI